MTSLCKAFNDNKDSSASTINRETMGQVREHNCFNAGEGGVEDMQLAFVLRKFNLLLGCPYQGCPVINSVFGCLCRKTVPWGREDTRVWHREAMSSQMVSYDFPLHGLLHEYFLYLVSAPQKPRRRCEPEEGYLRCSKRFDHRSHSISFVIVRV